LHRQHLGLLDFIAEDAIARGDLDEADQLLDASITADPMEEIRYVRLARALIAQGRVRQALRVAQQGAEICADLGVEPTDELAELLSQLAGSA
jgi:DNA-binding SARP family transcriptional activator